jgi:hypothetical protein
MTPLLPVEIIAREIAQQASPNISSALQGQICSKILTLIHQTEASQNMEITLETLLYNIPFFVQALLRSPTTILRLDDPYQVFYAQHERNIPLTKISFVDWAIQYISHEQKLGHFIHNFSLIAQEFSARREEIQQALEKGNLIILSNHVTWLNLVIIAVCLHYYCGISPEKIYTLL